jgi:hypothetical protein
MKTTKTVAGQTLKDITRKAQQAALDGHLNPTYVTAWIEWFNAQPEDGEGGFGASAITGCQVVMAQDGAGSGVYSIADVGAAAALALDRFKENLIAEGVVINSKRMAEVYISHASELTKIDQVKALVE